MIQTINIKGFEYRGLKILKNFKTDQNWKQEIVEGGKIWRLCCMD